MKSLIKISFILFSISCASYNYKTTEKRNNNTIQIKSDNLSDYRVVSEDKNLRKTRVRDGSASAYFVKLKKKNLSLYLVHENYDSIRVDAIRVFRKKALVKDVSLGVFTFGIPLIIDVFKSDFYKISPMDKDFVAHFVFKQEFMLAEYNQIKGATKPAIFQNWIDNYGHSFILQEVIDHKDSLELNIALSKESEKAIDKFIQSHQQSNFLSEAEKIKVEMVEARKLFAEVKIENTVAGFEKFLNRFPRSLHNTEVHKLLVYSAIKEGKEKNDLESILVANSDYLLKFKGFLSNEDFIKRNKEISLKVDEILMKKLVNSKKSKYDAYSEFWMTFIKIKKENKNVSDLPRSLNKNKNIANFLIRKLYKLKSETSQDKFLDQARLDFPYLDGQTFNNNPVIKNIVQLADNFSGTLILKNQNYLTSCLKNSYEGDAFLNLTGFTYKGTYYNQPYKNGNVEKITMKNGQVSQLIVLEGSKKIIDAKFELNKTRQSLKYKSISFYIDGKLVKTEYSDINNVNYFYEFENGKNLSLIELERKIKEADQQVAQINYDYALKLYTQNCKNDYPATIPLNKRITNSIKKTQVKRNAYIKKIEEKRLAEEKIRRIEREKAEIRRIEREKIRQQNLRSARSDCRVNISSESSIQRYLERGLRTETNGGSTIKYKVLSSWNTVGLEIKFDNGKVVKGINVRIKPGYQTARISVDFPSIGGSAVYILYSNGLLESSDGTFKYKCK